MGMGGLGGGPLPPRISGIIELGGKSRKDLWGTITYGQNLGFKELSLAPFRPL